MDKDREMQNLQRQVQINRQAASKIRQAGTSKKDATAATPIKEEDDEDEVSDHGVDPRPKKQPWITVNGIGAAAAAEQNNQLHNYGSKTSLARQSSGRQTHQQY